MKGHRWKGHNALFFEHEGNKAVRQGEWKLVSAYPENRWQQMYDVWATHVGVIPFEKLKKGVK